MDPRKLMSDKLVANFPKFGGFIINCTYSSVSDSLYDANTGVTTDVIVDNASIGIIFTEFSFGRNSATVQLADEASVQTIDRVALFPAANLPFDPNLNDKIIDASGVEWRVMAIEFDAGKVAYQLHVRPQS